MFWHCLKCRKNTENKNPKDIRTKDRGIIFLSKCEMYGGIEASGLLDCLGIKKPLSKIPLLRPVLF